MWGHLGSWDLPLNKIGKGPLGNDKYQISSGKSSGFKEEEF